MSSVSFVAESLRQRVSRVPAWVIVLATAAVVGSISAMVSVTALARVRNSQSALQVPAQEVES